MLPITSNELLNAGLAPEVPAVPAATTIVLRGDPFEVLFMRRSAASTFVPDAWIFPGGAFDGVDRRLAVDAGDDDQTVARYCAARELFEEAGVWIGPPVDDAHAWRRRLLDAPDVFEDLVRLSPPDLGRLVWTSRWVTPVGAPKRYDTWFFLLEADQSAIATPEHREGMEIAWLSPSDALARHRAGSFSMVFPTIRNLMAIEGFTSPGELIASRRGADIPTVRPILKLESGKITVLLPGEE